MRFASHSSYFAGKLDFLPLLNVLLLLLFFFLLCSSFFVIQVGEPLVLPKAPDATAGSAPSRLILVVSHDDSRPDGDKIFFNDELTSLDKLPGVLTEARKTFPGDSLIAKIDRGVPTATLVSVLQIARELDLKVTLATSLAPAEARLPRAGASENGSSPETTPTPTPGADAVAPAAH